MLTLSELAGYKRRRNRQNRLSRRRSRRLRKAEAGLRPGLGKADTQNEVHKHET